MVLSPLTTLLWRGYYMGVAANGKPKRFMNISRTSRASIRVQSTLWLRLSEDLLLETT